VCRSRTGLPRTACLTPSRFRRSGRSRASRAGAQFIIATHSPILLACPGARIHSFDQCPIVRIAYKDLDHVVVTRDFLNDPGRFLAR
jgi:predicted ATPase